MRKISLLFIFIAFRFLCFSFVKAQTADYTPEDQKIFASYLEYIMPFRNLPKEIVLQKTAEYFLEKPYVANTLDKNEHEKTVINLRQFDCVTFAETVIALANTVEGVTPSFEEYAEHLRRIRYRNGVQEGYDSRLHYTSDWIYDNAAKGLVKNISCELGCILESKTVDFMSSNRSAYPALKTDDEMLGKIVGIENRINRRGGFYYLPVAKINAANSAIPHMAMVAFTTTTKGLDTTHVGFAYRQDGVLRFVHASSAEKKVVIDRKTLQDYCASRKSCTGVMIVTIL